MVQSIRWAIGCVVLAAMACGSLEAAAPDFRTQVAPILKNKCSRCHSGHKRKGGFSINTHRDFLQGSESGKLFKPGEPADKSLLIRLVTTKDEDERMPSKGKPLTAVQIQTLREWVTAGAPWPDGYRFVDWAEAPLKPRAVTLPPGSGHPIDRLMTAYRTRHKLKTPSSVDDRAFARRLWLDLVGLLPPAERLEKFVADPSPDKRRKLVDALLADDEGYSSHWMSFWSDLLRNDYTGTGFITGGRKQITGWLYDSLHANKPYDRMTRELIEPAKGAEGFINGIKWRGNVNASQTRQMQAAQNVAQVFMGTNLKCASCHDSFVNRWRLNEAYALAGVFADKPLEVHRCDKKTGRFVPAGFIFPELGRIDPKASKSVRMKQLAKAMTSPENGRLARTMVNRLWAKLMGRGIVEPVDDMDQAPFDADLLDWLAVDFAENGYDLKHVLRRICTSAAYQSPAIRSAESEEGQFVFQGPVVRRMSAEQFVDAVAVLSHQDPGKMAAKIKLPPRGGPSAGGHGKKVFDSGVMKNGAKQVDVDLSGARTLRLIVTDGRDGTSYDWADWGEPTIDGKPLTGLKWLSATSGHGQVRVNRNVVNKPMKIAGRPMKFGLGTHAASQIVYRLPRGAKRFKATVGPDSGSVDQKGTKVSIRFVVMLSTEEPAEDAAGGRHVRASLTVLDELSRALGRPNRDQVVTQRESVATMLQALELTNGKTLDDRLKQGARHRLKQSGGNADKLIDRLFAQALGRKAVAAERAAARQLLGTPLQPQGVEDLLWVVLMLPEFQLIH